MAVKHTYRGSALIIALIVVAFMAIIVAVIAFLVNNSIRSNRSYSDALHSRYAVEAGEEYALYHVFAARQARTVGAETTAEAISSLSDTFASGASYTVAAEVDQRHTSINQLTQNETLQMNLYTEEHSSGYRLGPLSSTDPVLLAIEWEEPTDCSNGSSAVELSFAKWSPFLWEDFLAVEEYQTRWVIQCDAGSAGSFCEYQHQLDPGFLYRLRIKALHCAIDDIVITTQNQGTGEDVYAVNAIRVNSSGQYSTARQEGNVIAPWTAPVLEYFDYVIFSEQDLIK